MPPQYMRFSINLRLVMPTAFLLLLLILATESVASERLRLAITTTTENSGILAYPNQLFEQRYNVTLDTIVVGSGQALQLATNGDVDVILVHSPQAEQRFMQSNYGLQRTAVMHNEFILLGPSNDPLQIKQATSITNALQLIHQRQALFVSRGDQSGTHEKEKSLWKLANIYQLNDNYLSAGQDNSATLLLANELGAYTLSDSATLLTLRSNINMEIIYAGDAILKNPYHIIAVNPEKHPTVNAELAKKYIQFITSEESQQLINDYKLHHQQLFHLAQQQKRNTQLTTTQYKRDFLLDAIKTSLNLIINLDQDIFLVVWTSLKISSIATLIAAIISIPLGLLVALQKFIGRRPLMSILHTLMALPTVIVGLLLYGLLNRQGLLGGFSLLYTPTAMIIGQSILIIPIIWNLSIAAVNSADPRIKNTCLSLGANPFQQGLVYLSEVRFALTVAVITGFGRAIGEVGIAMMLGGNIENFTRTMTTAITLETSKGEFEFALALGIILLAVSLLVNTFLQQFQEAKL